MPSIRLALACVLAAALLNLSVATSARAAPLALSPRTADIAPGSTLALTASNGGGGYVWALVGNGSGGSIAATSPTQALYTAGPAGTAQDVVSVTSADGATVTATITVPGASQTGFCASNSIVYAPGQGASGLVLFEDLWPLKGDLDFNDQAVAWNEEFLVDENGQVLVLKLSASVLSVGATLHNGLSLHLPLPAGTALTATETIGGVAVAATQITSNGEPDLVFRLVGDTRALFAPAVRSEKFINTVATVASASGQALTLQLTFSQPVALDPSGAPFDLFLSRTDAPGHEIHLPQFAGTAAMDTSLFNTGNDDSSRAGGLHFIDEQGLPFALSLPQIIEWPQETKSIDSVYADIIEFGASGGRYNQGWYLNATASADAFSAGAGLPPPAPATITDLQCSDAPLTVFTVVGMNDSGDIAGYGFPSDYSFAKAFVRRADGTMTLLPLPGQGFAAALNNLGEVVGIYQDNGRQWGYSWTAHGGVVTLGEGVSPASVNDSGAITGQARFPAGNLDAFLWTPADGLVDLNSLGDYGAGVSINAAGQVAGNYAATDGHQRVFFWSSSTGITDIGLVYGGTDGTAAGLSSTGQVIGQSNAYASHDGSFCFAWTWTTGVVVLDGSGGCLAQGVNASGVVVGWATIAFQPQYGIYSDGRSVFATPNPLEGPVGTTRLWAINDSGLAVGDASFGGNTHAIAFIPGRGTVDLGAPTGGSSTARFVNAAGQIGGVLTYADGTTSVALWPAAP